MQGELLAPVYLDLLRTPINNPVFQHSTTRIELEFGLAVTSLVGRAGREYLDDELGGGVEMAFRSECSGTAGLADPHHIWYDVVVIGEDHARREIRLASPCLYVPGLERHEKPCTGPLMMPVRLS